MTGASPRSVPALLVNQWLPGWEKIDFDAKEHRAKPAHHFYLISLPARELRSLSGIVRRTAKQGASRTDDLGIQRQHDPERSKEIARFVEFGYPWSTLNEAKRESEEFNNLRKPGWLPTAIVLNVLTKGTTRNGSTVADEDLASIVEVDGQPRLKLPYTNWSADWAPSSLPPFEVIDGQHRLWAFEGTSGLEEFQLPIVAFVGLDISWQAYLFWTINIKPKRINASLAFDLYPLLRGEDWLDSADGHIIYRETRAQELTEILWSYPQSPWYDRINMLGERHNRWVSQSAWIKSITASFVRPWDRRAKTGGGLFGGRSSKDGEVLGWSRAQQAAFLICAWRTFADAIKSTNEPWAANLRNLPKPNEHADTHSTDVHLTDDFAFYGNFSLICTDQGVRGFLQVVNDIFYQRATLLKLDRWLPEEQSSSNLIGSVEYSLSSITTQNFVSFLRDIAVALASFDWRSSSAPGLDEAKRRAKLVFRGSSGYKELRTQLLEHLAKFDGDVGAASRRLLGHP